jgi:hypothetical protein
MRASWLTVFLLIGSLAQADGLSADEIARRALRADAASWEGSKIRMRMALLKKGGERSERQMEIVARRTGKRIETVIRFAAPASIAGTAFLSRELSDGSTEQHIYLPRLKRTRRIVGREREGSFLGSDFSYADMQRIDPRYTKHSKLPDENVGSDPCHVIETSIDAKSGSKYGKMVTWVRKRDNVALRTRFHDRAGKLVKTLYARRVREMNGKLVVVEARMQDAKSGHATELIIDAMEPAKDLPDTAFTPAALEHM